MQSLRAPATLVTLNRAWGPSSPWPVKPSCFTATFRPVATELSNTVEPSTNGAIVMISVEDGESENLLLIWCLVRVVWNWCLFCCVDNCVLYVCMGAIKLSCQSIAYHTMRRKKCELFVSSLVAFVEFKLSINWVDWFYERRSKLSWLIIEWAIGVSAKFILLTQILHFWMTANNCFSSCLPAKRSCARCSCLQKCAQNLGLGLATLRRNGMLYFRACWLSSLSLAF